MICLNLPIAVGVVTIHGLAKGLRYRGLLRMSVDFSAYLEMVNVAFSPSVMACSGFPGGPRMPSSQPMMMK